MKITNEQLIRIIKEEIEQVLSEQYTPTSGVGEITSLSGPKKLSPGEQRASDQAHQAKIKRKQLYGDLSDYEIQKRAEEAFAATAQNMVDIQIAKAQNREEEQRIKRQAERFEKKLQQQRNTISQGYRDIKKIKKEVEKQINREIPMDKFIAAMKDKNGAKFWKTEEFIADIPEGLSNEEILKVIEDKAGYWDYFTSDDEKVKNTIPRLVAYFNKWYRRFGAKLGFEE